MAKSKKEQLTIDARDVPLSNLDKKLTLKRYPNGALEQFF
jgi:hypothetical protein